MTQQRLDIQVLGLGIVPTLYGNMNSLLYLSKVKFIIVNSFRNKKLLVYSIIYLLNISNIFSLTSFLDALRIFAATGVSRLARAVQMRIMLGFIIYNSSLNSSIFFSITKILVYQCDVIHEVVE